MEITCALCNKNFERNKNEVNRSKKLNRKQFCSRTCSDKFRTLNIKPKAPNVECAYCKKKFYKSKSKLNSKSGLYFCCRSHKDLSQKIGGIKEIHPSHYGTQSRNYRSLAFKNYPCQCNRCHFSREPKILIVHHIDRNRNNNTLSNLEILCPNCHSLEHLSPN